MAGLLKGPAGRGQMAEIVPGWSDRGNAEA